MLNDILFAFGLSQTEINTTDRGSRERTPIHTPAVIEQKEIELTFPEMLGQRFDIRAYTQERTAYKFF